ncbi:MAG: AAA family ATPase [Candidatus Hodarchaeales archaeon]|jgi:MoxR-like ATPase
MESREGILRAKVLQVINTIEENNLYIHSNRLEVKSIKGTIKFPLVSTICVLNSLVPRSAMLLSGGYGGGKTSIVTLLGRMLTSQSLRKIQEGILRGHPNLTEEKMIATLEPGPLLSKGVQVVAWRDFVKAKWKIVDEVNRLSEYNQNILLSLLAEGRIKYYDQVYDAEDFTLYATMNPGGTGTFKLGTPFLDRFALSLPISSPTLSDNEIIIQGQDEKLFGYDEMYQVPAILTFSELNEIKLMIEKTDFIDKAEQFIHALIRETTVCVRVEKTLVYETVGREIGGRLCDTCHWNVQKSICNKVITPLSTRALKDLKRFAKAITWLCGAKKTDLNHILPLAPFVVAHRALFVERELSDSPYWGDRHVFARWIVEQAHKNYIGRKTVNSIFRKFVQGQPTSTLLGKLEKKAKVDLLTAQDILPACKEMSTADYVKLVKNLSNALEKRDIERIQIIKNELLTSTDFPQRPRFLQEISDFIYDFDPRFFKLTLDQWKKLLPDIVTEFPSLNDHLIETMDPPSRKLIRTESMQLEILVDEVKVNSMTKDDESSVFLTVSGSVDASKVKQLVKIVEETRL